MITCTVIGQVTDENGDGVPNRVVRAYDVEPIGEESLGGTRTGADGRFTLRFRTFPSPDVIVRVFDWVGRLLFESAEHRDAGATLDVGTIVVPRDVLRGWRVTLRTGYLASAPPGPPAEAFPRFSTGNRVEPYVDNELAWMAVGRDIENAADFIAIVQLWLDPLGCWMIFDPPNPPENSATTGSRLMSLLLSRNRQAQVAVRLLLNEFIGDQGLLSSGPALRRFLSQLAEPHTIELRRFERPYNNPLHSKVVVVDGKVAYLLGSPFIQGYYDSSAHAVDEPRRGPVSAAQHVDCTPLHDVSVALTGPATRVVADTVEELWARAGDPVPTTAPAPAADGDTAVQIVRTVPAGLLPSAPGGETGILEGYLRAIAGAESFIFIDNQYFTEPLIARALVTALRVTPTLEVIMVVNGRVDLPNYNSLQPALITDMHRSLNAEQRVRLGVFTMWSHDDQRKPQPIIRGYTHAKVAIVDDKWATIGSANTDGVSMHLSQHVVQPITRRDRREERAVEMNAMIFNGVDGLPSSSVPDDFRRDLWADHLGMDAGELREPPPGKTWLGLWRERAESKLAALTWMPPKADPARVLPWRVTERGPLMFPPASEPRDYLLGLDIPDDSLALLEIRDGGRSFDFATGTWRT